MLVRVHRQSPARVPPLAPAGRELLMDRGLLAQWFMVYRLDEELHEARRYEYPLSIVILSPMIIAGDPTAEARVRAGALAAKAAARMADLIGWLDGDDILVILPHTDRIGALAAIERWRGEMYAETGQMGGLKWLAAAVDDVRQFTTAAELLSVASNEFRGID